MPHPPAPDPKLSRVSGVVTAFVIVLVVVLACLGLMVLV